LFVNQCLALKFVADQSSIGAWHLSKSSPPSTPEEGAQPQKKLHRSSFRLKNSKGPDEYKDTAQTQDWYFVEDM
jgi:hypothetical protein